MHSQRDGGARPGDATCFAAFPSNGKKNSASSAQPKLVKSGAQHNGPSSLAGTVATSFPRNDHKLVVGYSDGSLAALSMPSLSSDGKPGEGSASAQGRDAGGRSRGDRAIIRRLRRVGGGKRQAVGLGEGDGVGAAITALCPLSPPYGLLVVAGDTDGRLSLWTTSIRSPSAAR